MSDDELTILTSFRTLWAGAFPRTRGWPFCKTTLSDEGVLIRKTLARKSAKPLAEIPLTSITAIERTQKGVRIFREGEASPVVVASLWKPERLAEWLAATCPRVYQPTVVRSSWTRV